MTSPDIRFNPAASAALPATSSLPAVPASAQPAPPAAPRDQASLGSTPADTGLIPKNAVKLDMAEPGKPEYVPGQVLVKFKDGLAATDVHAFSERFGLTPIRHFEIPEQMVASFGGDLYQFRLSPGDTVESAIERLSSQGDVAYAEPNYRIQLDDPPKHAADASATPEPTPEPTMSSEKTPNDLDSRLWGMKNNGQDGGKAGVDIGATRAWATQTGLPNGQGPLIAIIDTGIDYTHPDLATNVWNNPKEVPGVGIDNDGSGYIDDQHGANVNKKTGDPMDDNEHGTHVAGTIAAVINNGQGVAGVAPGVRIMACKFLDSSGSGSSSDAITCLDYAVQKGARIANASWGGGPASQSFLDALNRARAAGLLLVCAAGNESADNDAVPHYPSNYEVDNVLAVGAMTRSEQVASFSNVGLTTVDLFAPGSAILSTIPGGSYASFSGTSMAAPHASGVAALVLSTNRAQSHLAVRSRVLAGVEPLPEYAGKCVTGGRLNARLALEAPIPTVYLTSLSPGSGTAGSTVTLVGQGFGASKGTGSVVFGSTAATVTSWTDARIDAVVPATPPGASTVHVVTGSGARSNDLTFLVDTNLSYLESSTPFDFRSIASTGQALTLGDDGSQTVDLGFTFPFYGEDQASVTVASNGYLTFGGSGTVWDNAPIPSTSQPNRLVAPLWTDLNPSSTGTVHVKTRGTAPNRECVAQWTGVPHYPDTGAATFQAVLREGTRDILFHYQDATFGNASYDGGADATIGVESMTGSSGTQHAATVADGTSLRFALSGSPGPSPSPSPSPSPQPALESLPLSAGWNCVSFPLASLTQVQMGSGVGKVFTFDASQQKYQDLTPTVAGFNAGTGLRRGFWIYSSAASQIGFAGVENRGALRTVDLKTGWNLVGAPYRQALVASEILVTDLSTTPTPAAVPLTQAVTDQVPAPAPYLLFSYLIQWRSGAYAFLDTRVAGEAMAPKLGHWIYAWKPVRLEYQAIGVGQGK